VFTPSVLTILGIILFRRLGYVVGSAGLGRALFMLALATTISVITSLSLSAIATNRKVKGGGDYYLISRSLGLEYGGALGLILFAAQAISVAFYCIGFGEAVVSLTGGTAATVRLAAAGALVVLFGLAYAGADLATRFQFVIMIILVAALASFFSGSADHWDPAQVATGWTPAVGAGPVGFWVIFAIFFPAVTGFTQGVSMSGDLKEPAHSLPRGTFLAIGVSTVVYVVAMIALAGSATPDDLAGDYDVMKRVATIPWLIDAGVLSATLSSALASFLGAPRILQALARDRLFATLTPFAEGHGRSANPRRAVLLTSVIALVAIALGDLNAIAAVISMFFLLSYGLLNYATYVEAVGASPSFRPRFRFFDARVSLAATALCGLVMLMIDPLASAVALGVLGALYHYLRSSAVPTRWHDSRRAYRFRLVKDGLRDLATVSGDPADWQPHILAFTETAARRERVLRVAAWIAGGSGMITAVQLIEGDSATLAVRTLCAEATEALRRELDTQELDAYPLVVAAPDLRQGATTLLQTWGVGPIRANTVLLNWYDSRNAETTPTLTLWYARLLQRAARLDQHVVVLDAEDGDWRALRQVPPEARRIDVWWFEDDSSRLALLFGYLMTRDEAWDEATLRVVVPAPADRVQKIEVSLRRRLEELRIDAEVVAAPGSHGEEIYRQSADAAFVLLPLRLEGMRTLTPTGGPVAEVIDDLPVTALVSAFGDVRLNPDEETEDVETAEAESGADAERSSTDKTGREEV
jgi:amino acid transporter